MVRKRSRYLEPQVIQDLDRKMVFVAGPRQVGKTTLARNLLGKAKGYLSWDISADRESVLQGELPPARLGVFDEIHKYRRWRNYLKGVFDGRPAGQRILVTGSGRLDLDRFGGDSLQGRYHLVRLHPLSAAELNLRKQAELHDLLRLPALVGSPLSINALREDLQVSHRTVSTWIEALERLYAVYRLTPFGAPRIRAVLKEQKHYHFDWSIIPNDGPRFENMVAPPPEVGSLRAGHRGP